MSRAEDLAGRVRLRDGVCCRLRTVRAEFVVDGRVDSCGTGLAHRTLPAVGVSDSSRHSDHSTGARATGAHAAHGAVIVVFGSGRHVLS